MICKMAFFVMIFGIVLNVQNMVEAGRDWEDFFWFAAADASEDITGSNDPALACKREAESYNGAYAKLNQGVFMDGPAYGTEVTQNPFFYSPC